MQPESRGQDLCQGADKGMNDFWRKWSIPVHTTEVTW